MIFNTILHKIFGLLKFFKSLNHFNTKDTNGEPISGYHDHEIGHKFDRTPHFNAWSESTGTSSKKNVHLYYE